MGLVVGVPATAQQWRRVVTPSVEQEVAARRAVDKKQVVQDGDESLQDLKPFHI